MNDTKTKRIDRPDRVLSAAAALLCRGLGLWLVLAFFIDTIDVQAFLGLLLGLELLRLGWYRIRAT